MKKIKNNPHLTAIKRTRISFPTNWLMKNNLFIGKILDFGCGLGFDVKFLSSKGFKITGYDNYYHPKYPTERFDTIICNYVLNILEPYQQTEVLLQISQLLKPNGKAYFAVRRNIKNEGFRMHYIHKQYTYQSNIILPFKSIFRNKICEIYEYQHFNQIVKQNINDCIFCNLDKEVEFLCETDTTIAFFDKFPVNKGHTLIIPKQHIENYFDLSFYEQQDLWFTVNYCKEALAKLFNPDGFNIGINIGKDAGQSIFHTHIHLIPRYKGDVENPKGGVRGVIPNKQNY